jgi:hypothetical protein
MIDGIKFRLPAKYVPIFKANEELDFIGKYRLKDGMGVPDKFQANYKCFTIDVYKEVVRVSGSLHKFAQGGTNEDNFTYDNICLALKLLSDDLDFELQDTLIENIEFGINIPTTYRVTDWLKSGVIAFGKYKPRRNEDHKSRGYYIEFESKSYWRIKIYDKGKQYSSDIELLRVEKKLMNNKLIQDKLKVKTLNHLLVIDNYSFMKYELLKVIQKLVCIDTIDVPSMKLRSNKSFIIQALNPSYWVKLTAEQRRTSRTRFKRICEKRNLNLKQKEVAKKSNLLWNYLMNNHRNMPLPKEDTLVRSQNKSNKSNKSKINYKQKYYRLLTKFISLQKQFRISRIRQNVNLNSSRRSIGTKFYRF